MPKDELIAALEKATGPDRELDARIWCLLNGKRYCGHCTPYGEREGRFVQVEYTSPPKRTRQVTNFPLVPHALCVTSSIDDALTLVPSGKGHDPWWMLKAAWRGKAKAEVWVDGRGKPFRGEAATPALAICIAALATERGEAGR